MNNALLQCFAINFPTNMTEDTVQCCSRNNIYAAKIITIIQQCAQHIRFDVVCIFSRTIIKLLCYIITLVRILRCVSVIINLQYFSTVMRLTKFLISYLVNSYESITKSPGNKLKLPLSNLSIEAIRHGT